MKPHDRILAEQLEQQLQRFSDEQYALPGIKNPENRQVLIEQILESIHRVKYVSVISARNIGLHRLDPSSELFDPIKAAILQKRSKQIDEAFWLVFLFVHFGKHLKTGWVVTGHFKTSQSRSNQNRPLRGAYSYQVS